jgi:hypothetical protein
MTALYVIQRLQTGGHAQAVGLQEGDAILSYDDRPVDESEPLSELIAKIRKEGKLRAVVRVLRGLQEISVNVDVVPLGVELRQRDMGLVLREKQYGEAIAYLPKGTFEDALAVHVGKPIVINLNAPEKFVPATLVAACKDHFVVDHDYCVYRYPYAQILRILERPLDSRVAISVNHLIVYKGAVGFVGLDFLSFDA